MKTLSLKKIALILFLSASVLGIQLGRIERPYFGHFASYQIVSAFIARNMLKEHFTQLLLPKTDFMIGKKQSLPLNQYPIHSLLAALGAHYFGGSLEFWGRFQAILFNIASIILTGLIAGLLFTSGVGWIAAVLMSLSPYSLIYGQMFMSESSGLFFLLLSLYILLRALYKNRDFNFLKLFIAGICFSLVLVGRIHFLMLLPVFWVIFYFSSQPFRQRFSSTFLFSFFALILPFAWFVYTYFVSIHADNVHSNLFLQLSGRRLADLYYLRDLNYYHHVFDIFVEKMLTPLVFPFLPIGLFLLGTKGKTTYILMSGLLSGTSIVVLIPQKVMAHEFYLYGTLPFYIMIAANGVFKLFEAFPVFKRPSVIAFFLMLYLIVSARYFVHPIYKFPEEKNELIPMAQAIREKTQPGDWLVIASRGFSELRYYVDRPSWDISFPAIGTKLAYYFKDPRFSNVDHEKLNQLEQAMYDPISWLEYLKMEGAAYLVVPNERELDGVPEFRIYLDQHYPKLPLTQHSLLFKLTETARQVHRNFKT